MRGVPMALAVICVVLCFGEVQTRLSFLTPRLEYQADRELTGLFRPNQCGYLWMANQSMKTPPMTVNPDGHRGESTDWTKPTILALGSSEAFGTGVADDEVWTYLLEDNLRQASLEMEVVNAAGPGMGAYQQDVVLKRLLLAGKKPELVLVRVSIGDRGFGPIPEERRMAVFQASLKMKRIREFTTFLPFLRNKLVSQLPSIRSACRPSIGRRRTPSVYHDTGDAGQEMVANSRQFWESMIGRAAAVGSQIVFIVHAPHGYHSSQVLYENLMILCTQHESAFVLQLGPDTFGMEGIPVSRRGSYFHERFTLVRDPHANARQHKLIGDAVTRWLVAENILER